MRPFGETVLLWRIHRGLTQAQLAAAAAITRPNLSAIERGEREVTLRVLRALAVALDVKPGVLADGGSPYDPLIALSRTHLEQVARAAATGTSLTNPHHNRLARCFRTVIGMARSDRSADLAYLQLKAMATEETIASLQQRLAGYPLVT